jgi:hypothetical protein
MSEVAHATALRCARVQCDPHEYGIEAARARLHAVRTIDRFVQRPYPDMYAAEGTGGGLQSVLAPSNGTRSRQGESGVIAKLLVSHRPALAAVGLALALALVAGAGACVSGPGFQCQDSSQCTGGTAGACESTGYCSFADDSCGSGRRYGEESGSLGGTCLGPTVDGGNDPDADPLAPDAAPDALPVDANIIDDFDPSNIATEKMTAGTGDLILTAANPVVTLNAFNGVMFTPSATLDLPPGVTFERVDQTEPARDLGVLAVRNLVIEPGVTLTVIGDAALAIAVSYDATIDGVIDGSGGYEGIATAGPGGFAGGAANTPAGRGPGGGQSTSTGGDTGGGGGGYAAVGGAGGGRAAVAGGAGGVFYGEAELVPLIGGSGGGMAGGAASSRGRGGGGGGAIQISARGEIRLGASGIITVGGGGGGGGGNDDGGGGGGAGGAILLEARAIANGGLLAANGGGGGAGADANALPTPLPGANGERGTRSTSAAAGGMRSGEGGGGGAGAAGGTQSGTMGETTAGTFEFDNAGGGGGAGGRIRLRSRSSAPGVVSPADSLTEESL